MARTFFFGERWDAPAFDDAHEISTPVGEPCGMCEVPIKDGDSGTTMFFAYDHGRAVRAVHLGCFLRSVLGSPDHLLGRCSCVTGRDEEHFLASEADAYTEGQEVLRILKAQRGAHVTHPAEKDAPRRWWQRRPAPRIEDVPCGSCQRGYSQEHVCELPDFCPCDHEALHVTSPAACPSCGSVAGYVEGPPCLTCHFIPPGGGRDGAERELGS